MKSFKVVVNDGKKKIYIEHVFTETKEDVREKAANIILGKKGY